MRLELMESLNVLYNIRNRRGSSTLSQQSSDSKAADDQEAWNHEENRAEISVLVELNPETNLNFVS